MSVKRWHSFSICDPLHCSRPADLILSPLAISNHFPLFHPHKCAPHEIVNLSTCTTQPDSSDVIYKNSTSDSFRPSIRLRRPRKCRKLKISRISRKARMPDEKLIKNLLHTLTMRLCRLPSVTRPPTDFASAAKQSMMNNKGENLIN